MESVRTQNKLRTLFEKIVEPNYVMDNYYADDIINKLCDVSDPEIYALCHVPTISDCVSAALNHFGNVHLSVQVFLVRTLAIVSQKELHFMKITCTKGDIIFQSFKNINTSNMNASLKVAFMDFAIHIATHNSGINWLLETGLWKEILSLCNQKQTVFVVRRTYKFAAEFLWRLNDLCDYNSLKLILLMILKPLDQDWLSKESMSAEEEEEFAQTVDPTVHMLLAILSIEQRILKSTILMEILVKEFKICSLVLLIFDRLRREETVLLLSKLFFYSVLAKIFVDKPAELGVKFNLEDFLEMNVGYFNIIQFFVQRRNATLAVDYCTACNMIVWNVFKDKDKIQWVDDNMQCTLKNQILFICIVPLIVFLRLGKPDGIVCDQRMEEFTGKLLNLSCDITAKAAYSLRSLFEQLNSMQIIVQSVKKLSSLKNNLNNEQANLVFQALFYVLRDYDPIDDFGETKKSNYVQQYENDQDRVLVMTYVMDMVLCLLKHHNINWCESFEVICLFTVVYNILQRPNLTTKFVVAALNVITMTVKLFLPPNLSLLLESKPGSPMDQIGKLIYRKMHDLSWEVRDSALELLLVCTEISFIKFPPFQKQILDNSLINVAAALAFNDYESYVQVSALKCLGAASKVGPLWENLKIQYPKIEEQLLGVLRQNEEGIVRKGTCSVLCEVYQNLKLTPQYKKSLYDHMVSTTLSDFHWEVQITALKFWKIVFQSLLSDQGMLDGTFPPVTFSRETRKIVTLNEAEIQRRLVKILEELSSVGLLTVLIKLLNDDSEIEVMDNTLNLCNEILDVLHKYKVPECLKPRPGDVQTEEELMLNIKKEDDHEMDDDLVKDTPSSDNVIEHILNADDINLLANIYESQMTLQTTKIVEPVKPKIKLLKLASPHMFVHFVKRKDYKAVIENKRKWNDGIRNLSSLLDDVLGVYEVNDDVNALDCY